MSKLDIGRNDRCPCGSGKKYKRCCLLTQVPAPRPVDSPAPVDTPRPRRRGAAPDRVRDVIFSETADVMSPAYWEKISTRLPRDLQPQFAPLVEQAKAYAEFASRRNEVDAAVQALAAHRPEFVQFSKDPHRVSQRARELFADEQFAALRFQAADVQRAFDAVGYPLPGATDKALNETLGKAICFLVDDAQAGALVVRLYLTLPAYVAAGRYLDGWIVQQSAAMLSERSESMVGPFLLAMFVHGMTTWEGQRKQEEEALFKEIGIDLDQVKERGSEEIQALARAMLNQPDKTAALAGFFARHPELHAMSQAQCRAHEDAAIDLLRRPDAHLLHLSRDEVAPWLATLEQRMREAPGGFASMSRSPPPDADALRALKHLVYSCAREMARDIFTPARLERLTAQVHAYRRQLSVADAAAARAGVAGALMFTQPGDAGEENHFLVTLCWASLRAAMDSMDTSARGEQRNMNAIFEAAHESRYVVPP